MEREKPGAEIAFMVSMSAGGRMAPVVVLTMVLRVVYKMKTCFTVHKLWKVYGEVALFCVAIGQDSVVWERPAKSVWNNNNDSFRGSIGCVRNIAVEAVKFIDSTCWFASVEGAGGAT